MKIDEAQLIRAVHELIGNRLAHGGAGERTNALIQTLEMLDVQRRPHLHAVGGQLEHVLVAPPRRVTCGRVRVRGNEIRLTPTQFRVLLVLARHAGKALSHRAIVAEAWGDPNGADSANLRVVVGQLRRLVEENHRRPSIIVTLPGVGYRLDDPGNTS